MEEYHLQKREMRHGAFYTQKYRSNLEFEEFNKKTNTVFGIKLPQGKKRRVFTSKKSRILQP